MKKYLVLVLALVMLLSLCACSSGLAVDETGEKATENVTADEKPKEDALKKTYGP